MNKLGESTQDIAIADIQLHPELLSDLILSNDSRPIMVEKQADVVRITYLKTYDPKTKRIVAEARQEYLAKKQAGYSREQAFQDLMEARNEIAQHLEKLD